MGMTMAAIGIAQEMKGKGVAANSIWPVTLIESAATKNHQIGGPKQWRKADILVDAIMAICESDPNELTGQQLMDEDFLRSKVQLNIVKHSSCLTCVHRVLQILQSIAVCLTLSHSLLLNWRHFSMQGGLETKRNKLNSRTMPHGERQTDVIEQPKPASSTQDMALLL